MLRTRVRITVASMIAVIIVKRFAIKIGKMNLISHKALIFYKFAP